MLSDKGKGRTKAVDQGSRKCIYINMCVCAYAVYIECTDSEIRSLESRTNIQRRFGGEP